VWFLWPTPSGPRVGALCVVAFATGLLVVTGSADALEALVVVGLGLDVVGYDAGADAAEDTGRVSGQRLGADATPVGREAFAPVAAFPPAAHGSSSSAAFM